MSRALGDAYLKGIISHKPDIYTITDPQWILVASDGLTDSIVLHSSTASLVLLNLDPLNFVPKTATVPKRFPDTRSTGAPRKKARGFTFYVLKYKWQ